MDKKKPSQCNQIYTIFSTRVEHDVKERKVVIDDDWSKNKLLDLACESSWTLVKIT
jgi:hypothetical protein